jgi:tRNA A-37 threonylcarbamoyl transferase component Bud32
VQAYASAQTEIFAGRYEVEGLLGRGGMGAVYKVRDLATGEQVALKRLHRGADRKSCELLEREYSTLARLRHPRIVQVFDYGVDQGSPFYTMELLEGADLSQRSPMSWRSVCACVRDVASILGVLHARQLVHRDLSPRNLWQTSAGRLKLLDFGALTHFGLAREIAGTPPFVAPEALDGTRLDQRTDLFALGALGYWLLTSNHAFKATALSELPKLWEKEPLPPSRLAQHVPGASHDIPPELDRLILSLLKMKPDERPRSTADVVNLLDALAGLPPDTEEAFVQGYLDSTSFVGRARERHQFIADLARAAQSHPLALIIEGPAGSGRTRLLQELALRARISGAIVISASGDDASRPLQTAIGVAREVAKALPIAARRQPHADALFSLLDSSSASQLADRRQQARLHLAAVSWLLQLSTDHLFVIMIDDYERVDPESQAFFAALARADAGHRLLVTCALSTDALASNHPAVRTMRLVARHIALAPLSEVDTYELLRSVFGEALYLDRLAARLHKISQGIPAHLRLLVARLVQCGAAVYADGAWSLPRELPADLPTTLHGTVAASLGDLSADAVKLARIASVAHPAPLSQADLAVLASMPVEQVHVAVSTLSRCSVLSLRAGGLALASAALAESLSAELDGPQRALLRDAIIALLQSRTDMVSQVHSALQLLHAQRFQEAEARLISVSRHVISGEQSQLRSLVPLFLEALELMRAHQCDSYALMPVLNVLAIGGNLVKASLAVAHGDEALRIMKEILRFDLAQRLRPKLGARLSLLFALGAAVVGLRKRKLNVTVSDVLTWLVSVTGYAMHPAASCIDSARMRRHAAGIEPLSALGLERVILIHRLCVALALCLEDRRGEAQPVFEALIARLTSGKPIPGLAVGNERNLLAGCYYTYGYGQAFSCDARVLQTAERLEQVSPAEAIKADHLRMLYYAYMGEPESAARHEKQIEREVIELGMAFHEELLAPRVQARLALWTLDAAGTKRAARTLTPQAEETPSFAPFERWTRAADLSLRGRHREALALFEARPEDATDPAAWGPRRGLLANLYNGLGEHARAREVASDALAKLSERDREFVILNLSVEIELALAEAGVGDISAASKRLDNLAERHRARGRLVLGAIERARVRVAMRKGALDEAERHLTALEELYRPTSIPTLLLETMSLRDQLQRLQRPGAVSEAETWTADDAHLLTRFKLLLDSANDVGGRVEALRAACQLAGTDEGFLLCVDEVAPSTWVGTAPLPEAVAWAAELLASALEESDCTVTESHDAASVDANRRMISDAHHKLIVLWGTDRVTAPIAALVLVSHAGPPSNPPAPILQLLAKRLSLAPRDSASLHPISGLS